MKQSKEEKEYITKYMHLDQYKKIEELIKIQLTYAIGKTIHNVNQYNKITLQIKKIKQQLNKQISKKNTTNCRTN